MLVKRNMPLRDVQQKLCREFRQRFPLMSANLSCAGQNFDDFNDKPFVQAEDNDEVLVTFSQTTDLYFFDCRDRRRPTADPPCGILPELSLPPPFSLDMDL